MRPQPNIVVDRNVQPNTIFIGHLVDAAVIVIRAGGKPNPGTAPDKRLTENKPKPAAPAKPMKPPAPPPPPTRRGGKR